MSDVHAPGTPTKGILNTDDASTAAPVILYDIVSQAVVTIGTGKIFVVYLISISNGDSAAVVEVFDDLDADGAVDAGETLFKKSMNAKEQAGMAYVRGIPLKRAPKVKASASSANTSVVIYGDILL